MRRNPDNPSTLLYWNDLEGEPGLKYCGLAGYGLWLKMLGMAARSPEYGVVLIGDHPSLRQDLPALLATACGESVEVIEEIIDKLITFKVASVDAAGRVFNRRMVDEANLSAARSAAGRKGAAVTNSERQTFGKGVGKQGSKAGGNGSGKINDAQEVQNTSQSALKGQGPREGERQTDGNTIGKSSPSSVFCLSSVSKDTGAKAPRRSDDLSALVFGQCLSWLQDVTGKSRDQCASLLGKWRKSLGDEALIATLGRAQREGVIEPVGWMEKAVATHASTAPPSKGWN